MSRKPMWAKSRRWLSALVIILLGVSLWLNYWLTFKVLDYKGRLFLAHEFPDTEGVKVEKDSRQLVWMAGDSRIASWPLQDTASRRYINRGISGYTARETLERFRRDIAAGSRPDVLVIQAGINDVLSAGYNRRSRLPSAAIKHQPDRPDAKAIIARCIAELMTLAEEGRRAGCHVVILTIFPPGPYDVRDWFFWDAALERSVTEVNEALLPLAGPSISVIDTLPLLAAGGRTLPRYSVDSLHLNSAGYEKLFSALDPVLTKLQPPDRTSPQSPPPPVP